MPAKGHFIGGQWVSGAGEVFSSSDPVTGAVNWQGAAASDADVAAAVASARSALADRRRRPVDARAALLRAVAKQYQSRHEALVEAICHETGKPRWEAEAEVASMAAKIEISIEAYEQRRRVEVREAGGQTDATHYCPHGVVGVLGPFNMPGHLANGHIIPALLAGNTVVFKPSEQTPLVGERMTECWEAAGLGVVNMIQGAAATGAALAQAVDGLFFTGSLRAGLALARALVEQPGKIVALEMGGNNPLLVHEVHDLDAAAYLIMQSAFITAGQRCGCARRLIMSHGEKGDALLRRLTAMMGKLRVGFWTDAPQPFVGPVISARAAQALLDAQAGLVAHGGRMIVEMKRSPRSLALLSPGLIDVTPVAQRADEEIFGPLLQVIRVADFDEALREANATRYGLTAGLISDERAAYERFAENIRAGVITWNRPMTGVSSRLPFGGVGCSGNHRPAGSWASDYCSYPLAVMEAPCAALPASLPPGMEI